MKTNIKYALGGLMFGLLVQVGVVNAQQGPPAISLPGISTTAGVGVVVDALPPESPEIDDDQDIDDPAVDETIQSIVDDLNKGLPVADVLANAKAKGIDIVAAVAQIAKTAPDKAAMAVTAAIAISKGQAVDIATAAAENAPEQIAAIIKAANEAAPESQQLISQAIDKVKQEAADELTAQQVVAQALTESTAVGPANDAQNAPASTRTTGTAIGNTSGGGIAASPAGGG